MQQKISAKRSRKRSEALETIKEALTVILAFGTMIGWAIVLMAVAPC